MRKPIITLMIFILIIPLIYATEENDKLFTASKTRLELDINSKLIADYNSNAKLDKLAINLSFFPKESSVQTIESFSTNPPSVKKDNALRFEFLNPTIRDIDLNVKSTILIRNNHPEIIDKMLFPITNLDKSILIHTLPTSKIDSNDQNIATLASFIAEGETDEYVIVNKLGLWTKENVNYSLTSFTANAALNASWVLKNRYGVCDEITTLFIALNRALGIPAKFVSGVAYTNINNGRFGPHGWAEVYFPNTGWVPFDITYGQFGWIDATHIKLKEGNDPDDTTMSFEWTGKNINFDATPIKTETKLISASYSDMKPNLDLTTNIFDRKVGPKSFNLIEAKIKNNEDFYVAREFLLGEVKDMFIEDKSKFIILGPHEEKSIYWIVEFNGEFEKNFIITVPIFIYSIDGFNSSSNFEISYSGNNHDKLELEKIVNAKLDDENKKVFSKELSIDCIPEKKEIYDYERDLINCTLINNGNTFFRNLNICINEDCTISNLAINQKAEKIYVFSPKKKGANTVIGAANNKDISKSVFIDIIVKDVPKLTLTNLSYPKTIKFNDRFNIDFKLDKISNSKANEVNIKINSDSFKKPNDNYFKYMDESKNFNFNFYGKNLNKGENIFTIYYSWTDDNNKSYSEKEEIKINLEEVTFFQNIQLILKHLSLKI